MLGIEDLSSTLFNTVHHSDLSHASVSVIELTASAVQSLQSTTLWLSVAEVVVIAEVGTSLLLATCRRNCHKKSNRYALRAGVGSSVEASH